MADGISIKDFGLADIQRNLLQLPNNVNQRVVRRSVVAGAVIIRDEAVLKAPLYHGSYASWAWGSGAEVSKGHPPAGTLKRSIIVKYIPEASHNGYTVYYVTVRHGKKFQGQGRGGKLSQDAFYWSWVEFGTAKMSARPFMRPTFEAKKMEAANAIIESLRSGVIEEAGKL